MGEVPEGRPASELAAERGAANLPPTPPWLGRRGDRPPSPVGRARAGGALGQAPRGEAPRDGSEGTAEGGHPRARWVSAPPPVTAARRRSQSVALP